MPAAHNKLPLILVATVVVAVGIGTLVVRRDAPDGGIANVAPVPVVEPAVMPPSAPASVQRGGPRPTGGAVGAIGRRDAVRGEYARRSRELRDRRVATFEGEQVDPAWAPQKEVELGKIVDIPAFETAGVEAKALRVSCKSTMCRIDGSFESNGKAQDWLLIYMSSVGGSLPNSVVSRTRNPDGTIGVQIYGRAR